MNVIRPFKSTIKLKSLLIPDKAVDEDVAQAMLNTTQYRCNTNSRKVVSNFAQIFQLNFRIFDKESQICVYCH